MTKSAGTTIHRHNKIRDFIRKNKRKRKFTRAEYEKFCADKMESWCGQLSAEDRISRRGSKLRRICILVHLTGIAWVLYGVCMQIIHHALQTPLFVVWLLICVWLIFQATELILVRPVVFRQYSQRLREIYLAGFSLYDIFDKRLFNRLYCYTEIGFCYEAAALNMLAMKQNHTARYVIYESRRNGLHAFVEFRAFGLWWTLDPNWQYKTLQLRAWHNFRLGFYRPKRVISYAKFWGIPLVQEFDRKLRSRNTSYLFNELIWFHIWGENTTEMNYEKYHRDKMTFNGAVWDHGVDCIMGDEIPITHRMIIEYMINERRLLPRRRTYRHAMTLSRTIVRAYRETRALADAAERSGQPRPHFLITLTGIKSYKITKDQESQ